MPRKDNARGFTLVELAVVMAVMSAGLLMAWPAFGSLYKRYQLESAADRLKSCADFARASAVTGRRRYRMSFEFDARRCVLYQESEEGGSRRFFPVKGRAAARELPDSVLLETETPDIFFYPNGSSSAGVWILLGPGGAKTVLEWNGFSGEVRVREE